jgi:nucleoside-diphosphate-sugar epimerase
MTGSYNVASGQSISILKLAQTILSTTQSTSPITYSPARTADVRFSSASIARILATGWQPSVNLLSGLRQMLEQTQPSRL